MPATNPHQDEDNWYHIEAVDAGKIAEWEIDLLLDKYEVKTVRLPRKRKGKTPIDVGVVTQDDTTRVRLSMGDDKATKSGKKNSDLTPEEVEDLMAMLNYHRMVATGEIVEEPEPDKT